MTGNAASVAGLALTTDVMLTELKEKKGDKDAKKDRKTSEKKTERKVIVIDAGGGFQNYPDDYQIVEQLHADGQLTVRIAYNLFTQKPKEEKEDFLRWTSQAKYQQGDDYFRLNGAGEMLVYSAADFEDFKVERPDMPPEMEGELEAVVRILAQNRWPWRLHATYDESISRMLDVFEKVDRDIPFAGLSWFFAWSTEFQVPTSFHLLFGSVRCARCPWYFTDASSTWIAT